jgi:hypothetical protein
MFIPDPELDFLPIPDPGSATLVCPHVHAFLDRGKKFKSNPVDLHTILPS